MSSYHPSTSINHRVNVSVSISSWFLCAATTKSNQCFSSDGWALPVDLFAPIENHLSCCAVSSDIQSDSSCFGLLRLILSECWSAMGVAKRSLKSVSIALYCLIDSFLMSPHGMIL